MDEVETRELRYFVVLAEELHFGRAARRLGIAQPPLSRAIRRLEHRLGVKLVERTTRTTRLTAAGHVLLREGRHALDAVSAAIRRAQRAGRSHPHLVLAMKPGGDGGLLPAILAEYESQPDALPVELVFSAGERAAMLRDGRVDVALLNSPQNSLDEVVAVVPESIRDRVHDGLVCRPVPDAETATVVVAWAQHSTSRDVASFVRAATTAAARHRVVG